MNTKVAMTTLAGALLCTMLIPAGATAQMITIPDRIERLSAKATENVNVTLDSAMLQLASGFFNGKGSEGKGGDDQAVKNIVSKLKGIRVRTFEFAKPGEYSDSDLNAIRSQLKAPAWSRMVEATDKDEHTQVFVKHDKGQMAGLVILVAQPKELTIVSIDGTLDLAQLASLAGKFGIPQGMPTMGKPSGAVSVVGIDTPKSAEAGKR